MALARLLAPEAFGIMAIIGSSSSIFHTITDIGVKEGLIRHPRGAEAEYKGAAWWLSCGRAVGLYAIFFSIAPLIARFYGNPELSPLLRVVTLGVIFDGIYSSNAYIALKEMKFGRWAWMNNGAGICGIVLTVVMSFFIRDVWALVFGNLAESVLRCIFSYILSPYIPLLKWSSEAVHDLLRFSKGLFGITFLNLIFARTDIFVLGKLYSSAELGLYVMAVYLAQVPGNYVTGLVNQTLLPVFSEVQEDSHRINRILMSASSLVLMLGLPVCVFTLFCGHSVLAIVLGSRYSAVATSLVAAACVALINVLNNLLTTALYAKGLPSEHRNCVAIMAVIMIMLVYPLSKSFGLLGGQLAIVTAIIIGYVFQLWRMREITGFNLSGYAKVFGFWAVVSVTVAVSYLATRHFLDVRRPWANIASGLLGCILAYGLGAAAYSRASKGKILAGTALSS